MLDHSFLTASDLGRAVVFYERVLPILEITNPLDHDGRDGRARTPDLKGLGAKVPSFLLRQGTAAPGAVHVGYVADAEETVNSANAEALTARETAIHPPGLQRFPVLRGTGRGPGQPEPRICQRRLVERELRQ